MLDGIRVLQLGKLDWSRKYHLPDGIEFYYEDMEKASFRKPFDLVFVDRELEAEELRLLEAVTKAHTLYVTDPVAVTPLLVEYVRHKCGKTLPASDIQSFLENEVRNYFAVSYGEKFQPKNLSITQGFSGKVSWDGNYSVDISGDFGEEFRQIAYWRNNIPVVQGQAIDLWLEYAVEGSVEIALSIKQFPMGSISTVQQEWYFTEEQLREVVTIDNQMADGPIFVSLFAKGTGALRIIALHDRYSRRGHGHFLPGGERYVTDNREEFFCYFDPGDCKPPLNVYFSGYKTKQGFEGYHFMRKQGAPFLLIAEPRLEGGCFYMGSAEYEHRITKRILDAVRELGFRNDEVILCGLSMGTYGALYYGCDIRPHTILLGKPLASIGNVAANETLHRPGQFPTSLDVLHRLCGDTDRESVERLNARFWDRFDRTDWDGVSFAAAYMIEDDYDADAYEQLIAHLQSAGVQIYGKGIHGRHNDATGAIVSWFSAQLEQILYHDFGRKMERT